MPRASHLLSPAPATTRAVDAADETDLAHDHPRVASLENLTRSLQDCRTPFETLRAIRQGMVETFGSKAWILLSTRGERAGDYRVVQLLLGGRDADEHHDPWTRKDFPLYRGGIIGAVIRNRAPQILNDIDWTRDSYFHQTLAEYASMLAIPLSGESLPMTWLLVLSRSPRGFTNSELEQAVLRSAMMGSLLESKALAEELARTNQQIEMDAQEVGELQRALLPHPLPKIPGLEVAASYEPCGRAGGDLYDLFPLNDAAHPGRWCVFIGDASGHGLAAAVVIAMVQSILHAHPSGLTGPTELMAHLNRHLCRKHISGFVTAFLGIYDPDTQELTYACAGHPSPLVRSADGSVSSLDGVGGLPLGIDAGEIFEEGAFRIRRHDTVLLYTDGITDARNPCNEMLSEERLQWMFAKCRKGAVDLIEHLNEFVRAHREECAPIDDQTLVAIAGR